MRNGSLADLLKLIMEQVGEECITVRREYGDDGSFGVVISIGVTTQPEKDG